MLLVDDTKEIAEVICFYCQSKGIDCDCITEGRKALENIQSGGYSGAGRSEMVASFIL
jgi:DNA-binding response OmpR family regulator